MENVYIMNHPLIQHKISMLRNKNTGTNEFRKLVEEIGILMGYEALRDLPVENVEVETPIETCMTPMISGKKLAVIPVLRAGLGMVNSILTLVPSAKVGHVGLYRDPVTHEPHEYYCKLPEAIDERISDKSVTENTRVSYPINHIENIVRPISSAPAAKNVIFLSADAFGVLPPVSILTPEQTQYYFLSGFTAKLAGTERGITEPTPTFSACFGQAFLELHPTKYAEELVKRMEKSGAKAYLVNTGWNGTGKRISIKDTRGIIDAILNGDIQKAPTKKIPYFNFEVPTELPGVDPAILDTRDTYANEAEWEEKAKDLASRFIKNFAKYEGNEAGKALVKAGPQL